MVSKYLQIEFQSKKIKIWREIWVKCVLRMKLPKQEEGYNSTASWEVTIQCYAEIKAFISDTVRNTF